MQDAAETNLARKVVELQNWFTSQVLGRMRERQTFFLQRQQRAQVLRRRQVVLGDQAGDRAQDSIFKVWVREARVESTLLIKQVHRAEAGTVNAPHGPTCLTFLDTNLTCRLSFARPTCPRSACRQGT